MAELRRVTSESQLSTHSSLEEEEIDLEKERRRKENKIGQHRPPKQSLGRTSSDKQQRTNNKHEYNLAYALKSFGGVAIAGTAWEPAKVSERTKSENGFETTGSKTKASKRGKEKTVAMALEIAGGIAIAAAAWTPTIKLQKISTAQNNSEPYQSLQSSISAENKQIKKAKQYSVAEGLRIAGGVTIASSLWVPQNNPNKVSRAARESSKVANQHNQIKEYTVGEALRTAGGIAIAGISWTGKLPNSKEQNNISPARTVQSIDFQSKEERPILVDMATSPIPASPTPVLMPILQQHQPPTPNKQTPKAVEEPMASSQLSVTPELRNTPTPAVVAHSSKSLTPTFIEEPLQPATSHIVRKELLPSPQVTIVTPRPSTRKTPVVIKETIIRETSRPRSLRSREIAKPAALLVATNLPTQGRPISRDQTLASKPTTPSPPPYSPIDKNHQVSPPPIQVHEPTPIQTQAPETSSKQPPNPVEASDNDIEEIDIPEEPVVRVARAEAPKAKRKALAQLTPLVSTPLPFMSI